MRVSEVQVSRVVEVLSGLDVRAAVRWLDEDGEARWRLVYRDADGAEGLGVVDESLVRTVLSTMRASLAPAERQAA